MNIVLFTPDVSANSVGRTYCLWLLAKQLDWHVTVVSTRGVSVWAPLSDTAFAQDCVVIPHSELDRSALILNADLILAVKPVQSSFGIALELSTRLRIPLLLDVDDPDLDAHLSWSRPHRRIAKQIVRPRALATAKRLRAAARSVPVIVSNPVLQARYGGTIVPHIRLDPGIGAPHVRSQPTIAFVGSNRQHKGVSHLRKAVAKMQEFGLRLTITDTPPVDAKPWEDWTGPTSLEKGLGLVAGADIVVIPSLNLSYARGQLPAKLVDAMIMGRAIIVSNIEPMPWALGNHGVTIRPGSVRSIRKALRQVLDPQVRKALGDDARVRALGMFTVESNTGVFSQAIASAREAFTE
nr:hypothetical protein BJQ95_02100 [Cryobacterium sp. SO1]